MNDRVVYREIEEEEAGQRIDNFMICLWKGVPRSHIYKSLREVRVNKKRIAPGYRLQAHDILRLPPVRRSSKGAPYVPKFEDLEWLEECILLENSDVIVLNKPSGLAVHGGSGTPWGVIDAMRVLRPDVAHLELVHRLDKATSGCLLLAKKKKVLGVLHAALRDHNINKTYTALLKNTWIGPEKRLVDLPLHKYQLLSGEHRMGTEGEGKASLSHFTLQKNFAHSCFVEVNLHTGRTHQIRVHAAAIGHPIGGDEKYGDKIFNAKMRKGGVKGLCLHAKTLTFHLPHDTKATHVCAPMPDDLQNILIQEGCLT